MPKIPLGLSFDEDDDGYIIRQKAADGAVTEIRFKRNDLHVLKVTIGLWSDRILSQHKVDNAQAQPIVVHPVAQTRVLPDVLQANALLTVWAPSGAEITFAFSPLTAQALATDLLVALAQMQAANPTKQ